MKLCLTCKTVFADREARDHKTTCKGMPPQKDDTWKMIHYLVKPLIVSLDQVVEDLRCVHNGHVCGRMPIIYWKATDENLCIKCIANAIHIFVSTGMVYTPESEIFRTEKQEIEAAIESKDNEYITHVLDKMGLIKYGQHRIHLRERDEMIVFNRTEDEENEKIQTNLKVVPDPFTPKYSA